MRNAILDTISCCSNTFIDKKVGERSGFIVSVVGVFVGNMFKQSPVVRISFDPVGKLPVPDMRWLNFLLGFSIGRIDDHESSGRVE